MASHYLNLTSTAIRTKDDLYVCKVIHCNLLPRSASSYPLNVLEFVFVLTLVLFKCQLICHIVQSFIVHLSTYILSHRYFTTSHVAKQISRTLCGLCNMVKNALFTLHLSKLLFPLLLSHTDSCFHLQRI